MITEDRAFELIDTLVANRRVPDYLFSKKFKHHLFFDIDLSSSSLLVGAIKDIVISCVSPALPVAVFSATDRAILGWVESTNDWPSMVGGISERLRQRNDYNGLTLVDASNRWVVHQPTPVDLGIFGFDGLDSWRNASPVVSKCFVDTLEIRSWLTHSSVRDQSLVNVFGQRFLTTLAENYT
jgi:hypothetical protein